MLLKCSQFALLVILVQSIPSHADSSTSLGAAEVSALVRYPEVVVKIFIDVDYDRIMDNRYDNQRKQLLQAIQREMAVVLSHGQGYDRYLDLVTVTFELSSYRSHMRHIDVEVRMRSNNPSALLSLVQADKKSIAADVKHRIENEVVSITDLTGYFLTSSTEVVIFNVEIPVATTPVPPVVGPNQTAHYRSEHGVTIDMIIFNLPYDKVKFGGGGSFLVKYDVERAIKEVSASFLDFELSSADWVYSHRVDVAWQRGERPYEHTAVQARIEALDHEIPEQLKARIQMYQDVFIEDLVVKIEDVHDVDELLDDPRGGVEVEVVSVNTWETGSWHISAAFPQATAAFTTLSILLAAIVF